MITHEQVERAIEYLQLLTSYSPATEPDEYGIGYCLYCFAKVRNVNSRLIYHRDDCPFQQARAFVESLPSDWD
jgi:hypothetical protein